jgi:hypothetical protein
MTVHVSILFSVFLVQDPVEHTFFTNMKIADEAATQIAGYLW